MLKYGNIENDDINEGIEKKETMKMKARAKYSVRYKFM